ncbi:MAG: isochorismatase family protein [Myxococcales bacterium]|nr:isochorismatase family protein [Myxococcales bacterium]
MNSRLHRGSTTLVVMDVQERLVAAMPDGTRGATIDNIIRLVQGCRVLGIPVVITEQYPTGLGRTVEPLSQALNEFAVQPPLVSKVDFDACADPAFIEALAGVSESSAGQGHSVVLCGMETHICVYQTARALVERDIAVHVPMDASCCRRECCHQAAAGLLRNAGALLSCTETVLFECLGRAGTQEFKEISKLVR